MAATVKSLGNCPENTLSRAAKASLLQSMRGNLTRCQRGCAGSYDWSLCSQPLIAININKTITFSLLDPDLAGVSDTSWCFRKHRLLLKKKINFLHFSHDKGFEVQSLKNKTATCWDAQLPRFKLHKWSVKVNKRCVFLFIFQVIQKQRSGFLLSHWINPEVWHLGDPVNTTYHNYFTTLMMSPRGRALCSCTTLKRRTLPTTRTETDWRVNKILQSMSVTSDAATCCLSDKSFDTVTRQDLQYRDIPAINHMFQWQR